MFSKFKILRVINNYIYFVYYQLQLLSPRILHVLHFVSFLKADDSENLLPSSSDEASHDQSHDSSDSFIIKTTSTSELPTITSTPRKISKYDGECRKLPKLHRVDRRERERERERERDYVAVHSFSVAPGSTCTCKLLIGDSLRVKCGGAVGNYPPD